MIMTFLSIATRWFGLLGLLVLGAALTFGQENPSHKGKCCGACKHVEKKAGCCEGCLFKSQQGPPFGRGRGGPPFGRGRGGFGFGRQDPQFQKDRATFHFLLAHRDKIHRTVKNIANGVETVTESDTPAIAAKIQEHVHWMHKRVQNVRPIHMRDPLFYEVFRNAKKISMKVQNTKKGAKVRETSNDPYVVKLIQAHARVVSRFIKNGHIEAMKNHAVPKK